MLAGDILFPADREGQRARALVDRVRNAYSMAATACRYRDALASVIDSGRSGAITLNRLGHPWLRPQLGPGRFAAITFAAITFGAIGLPLGGRLLGELEWAVDCRRCCDAVHGGPRAPMNPVPSTSCLEGAKGCRVPTLRKRCAVSSVGRGVLGPGSGGVSPLGSVCPSGRFGALSAFRAVTTGRAAGVSG